MRCREFAPQAGPSPDARILLPPPATFIAAIEKPPPERTVNATFFPSGDQFGSVL